VYWQNKIKSQTKKGFSIERNIQNHRIWKNKRQTTEDKKLIMN